MKRIFRNMAAMVATAVLLAGCADDEKTAIPSFLDVNVKFTHAANRKSGRQWLRISITVKYPLRRL